MIKAKFLMRLGEPLISNKEEEEDEGKAKVTGIRVKSNFLLFFLILYRESQSGA